MDQDTRVAVMALTQFTGQLLARVQALEAVLIHDQIASAGKIRDARRLSEESLEPHLRWLGDRLFDHNFDLALKDTLERLNEGPQVAANTRRP